jgi:hypothetical protein
MSKNRPPGVKPKSKNRNTAKPEGQPGWLRILLALSLVPLLFGLILIGAWLLDWDLLGSLENQIVVGTLFVLFSFAASNLLQSKWMLAAGWVLLMAADWLVLTTRLTWVQIAALVLGILGAILVGFEYFRRIAQGAPNVKG